MVTSKISFPFIYFFGACDNFTSQKKPLQTKQIIYLNLIYYFYFQHKSASFN